ncbi:MAG: methyl-accepting chemotaxis protein [Eubacteriales bacterium]|nr:methyl-accepting chemotaxis protein [Eubacteriales bacterium]
MKKKFRITNVKSLVVVMIVVISLVITAASMITTYVEFGGDVDDILQEYMENMASSGGEIVQTLYTEFEGEVPAEKWTEYFADMHIGELPSSYAYIVDLNTTNMLFHPTADKIGQPVSNEVILGLCEKVTSGASFDKKKYVEYEFKGEMKMAAYSVVADNNCVLVISADKKDITSSVSTIMIKTLVITLLCLAIALVVVIIVNNKVMKELEEVTGVVQKLGQMELVDDEKQTARLCGRQSEIGDIARAVRDLRSNLRDIVSNLKENSEKLANYSSDLTNQSEYVTDSMNSIDGACNEIAIGATSQAHSTEEAIGASVKMGSLIDLSIAAVANLENVSQEVKDATYSAGDKLEEVRESNRKVTEVTEQIKTSILETSDSAEHIRQAADVITGIASQTNLLALNASIEAARAGESGRGFAVVASEISQLAEQSNQAAVEIQGIINELINNSNKSVGDIEAAKDITEEQTVRLVDAIGEFNKAKDGLDRSLVEIDRVKESTVEMTTSKNQVIDLIESLSAISEENAASTEETAASVTQAKSIVDNVAERASSVSAVAGILEQDAGKWLL